MTMTPYKLASLQHGPHSSDRAAWLNWRKTHVNASDVASLLGCGYHTRAQLLASKHPDAQERNGLDDNAAVQAGNYLEDGIVKWFAADHWTEFDSVTPFGFSVARNDYPLLAATPDACAWGIQRNLLAAVEVKVVGLEAYCNWHRRGISPKDDAVRKAWDIDLTPVSTYWRWGNPGHTRVASADVGTPRGNYRQTVADLWRRYVPDLEAAQVPLKFWVQAQMQAFVLDVSTVWVTASIAGTSRGDFEYARDDGFIARCLDLIDDFAKEMTHG